MSKIAKDSWIFLLKAFVPSEIDTSCCYAKKMKWIPTFVLWVSLVTLLPSSVEMSRDNVTIIWLEIIVQLERTQHTSIAFSDKDIKHLVHVNNSWAVGNGKEQVKQATAHACKTKLIKASHTLAHNIRIILILIYTEQESRLYALLWDSGEDWNTYRELYLQ